MKKSILFLSVSLITLSACAPVSPAPMAMPTPEKILLQVSNSTDEVEVLPTSLAPATTQAPVIAAAYGGEALPVSTTPALPQTGADLPTATKLQSPGATPAPTMPAAIALSPNDRFRIEMESSRYSLFQSAALAYGKNYIFSAYVFFRKDLLLTAPRNAWVLAFYRSDGHSNVLLGTARPSPYSAHLALYPRSYQFINWEAATRLPQFANLEDQTLRLLNLAGHTSDINRNGRPEFAVFGEYCPDPCVQPSYGVEYFEITPGHRIINLARGLPGLISLDQVSEDPSNLHADDVYLYDPLNLIRLPVYITWDGTRFVDVTKEHKDQRMAEIDALRASLEAQTGRPFSSNQLEINIWQLLLQYRQLGLPKEGLNAFLAITNAANWPGSDQPTLCWLAMARVHVQQEYDRGVQFTLFASRNDVFGYRPELSIKKRILSLERPGYDLSACQVFRKRK